LTFWQFFMSQPAGAKLCLALPIAAVIGLAIYRVVFPGTPGSAFGEVSREEWLPDESSIS
jgi:hypothetical protein